MTSQPHDLLDLHTLADPTDRHSLDELRAHLADSGDVQPDPADVAEDEREAETRLDSEEAEFLGFYRPKTRERRSGGDGR